MLFYHISKVILILKIIVLPPKKKKKKSWARLNCLKMSHIYSVVPIRLKYPSLKGTIVLAPYYSIVHDISMIQATAQKLPHLTEALSALQGPELLGWCPKEDMPSAEVSLHGHGYIQPSLQSFLFAHTPTAHEPPASPLPDPQRANWFRGIYDYVSFPQTLLPHLVFLLHNWVWRWSFRRGRAGGGGSLGLRTGCFPGEEGRGSKIFQVETTQAHQLLPTALSPLNHARISALQSLSLRSRISVCL